MAITKQQTTLQGSWLRYCPQAHSIIYLANGLLVEFTLAKQVLALPILNSLAKLSSDQLVMLAEK